MATIRTRNGKWQAQVRRNGHTPRTEPFLSKRDAMQWARQTETEPDATVFAVDLRVLDRTTMRDLLSRYRNEVTPAAGRTVEDLTRLCHYTNLRPLWKRDNRMKGGAQASPAFPGPVRGPGICLFSRCTGAA